MTRSAPKGTHICWTGQQHPWNPDGRCFVCEQESGVKPADVGPGGSTPALLGREFRRTPVAPEARVESRPPHQSDDKGDK